MSFIQNLFSSRDNNAQGNTYVGQQDRIWWDPDRNAFYYSDGNTAGGIPIGVGGGYGTPGGPANSVQLNSGSNTFTGSDNLVFTGGNLNVTGNISVSGNISPAAVGKIGGIQPGPGVNISNVGLLTIDSSNVPFSFGDFYANVNILTLVNVDEDMILATQGNAEVQLVGNIGFYKPDGFPPNIANRFAFFNSDGQATFYIPDTDPLAGAFKIVGSQTGNFSAPVNTGVMLHITGQINDASRIYNDSVGSFSAYVGRRINGNVESPTAVQAGDEIIRISSTGYDGAQIPGAGTARIVFQAMENYTPTARGSNLSLWATAVGSNTLSKIATIDSANGVNATKFTTSSTVSAAGNITGGNILTVGLVSATGNGTFGNVSVIGNTTTANLTVTGISDLNSNANVKISGGITGQSLATDGAGNLFWTSGTGGNTVIVNGTSTSNINIDFTYNSTTLLYLPDANVNITLANYVAGHTARVIIRYGATAYPISLGIGNVQQSTEGLTTLPISGAGGHNIDPNASVQLLYTCFDNTAGNCYVASTFL